MWLKSCFRHTAAVGLNLPDEMMAGVREGPVYFYYYIIITFISLLASSYAISMGTINAADRLLAQAAQNINK